MGHDWQRIRGRTPSAATHPDGGANLYRDILTSPPHLEGALATPDKELIVRSGHRGAVAREVIKSSALRGELVLSPSIQKFTTIMAVYT